MVVRGFALVLLTIILSLHSLAYASPPDPAWIGGFYDEDDYDDVVILVMAVPAAAPAVIVRGMEPHWTAVWLLEGADDRLPPVAAPPEHPTRGPPLA